MSGFLVGVASFLAIILLYLVFLFIFFGPDATDYARACRGHGGIAQIQPPLPSKAFAVCKDGGIAEVKA